MLFPKSMLKIIDTNYLIRYLMQDDFEKAVQAKSIIDEGAYILPESLVELVYALKNGYKINRKEICFGILGLLQDVEMVDKHIYENALRLYRDSELDFVDCVLVTRHKMLNDKIYTFDKELEKVLKG